MQLNYSVGYNYDIYQNYLSSNKRKFNFYFLNYTTDDFYCNNGDDVCTILYGLDSLNY